MTLRKLLAFIGISGAGFLAFLDFTVVNTALPVIQKELNMNLLSLQWILNIYLLVLAVLMVVSGKLGDIYGHRRVFYAGIIIFVIGSLTAGLAPHGSIIILGRFLQAIGASILFPIAAALLSEVFHDNSTKALGIYGAIGGAGLVIGPILGATLTTYLGWRYIFFINIPIGLLCLLACLPAVPASPINRHIKIDWVGLVLFIIGMGSLVYGVIHSATAGFNSLSTWIFLAIGLLGLITFIYFEKKVSQPLIDSGILTHPLFLLGAFSNMMAGITSNIALFFLPLYLHNTREISVMDTGIILSSITVSYIIFSTLLNRLEKKLGLISMLIAGITSSVVAALLQYLLNLSISAYVTILPCIFIGFTWAVGNILAVVAAHQSVTKDKIGVTTGTLFTFFNVGGSIALALAAVLFHALETPTKEGFIHGFRGAISVLFCISLITLLTSLFLLKKVKKPS